MGGGGANDKLSLTATPSKAEATKQIDADSIRILAIQKVSAPFENSQYAVICPSELRTSTRREFKHFEIDLNRVNNH